MQGDVPGLQDAAVRPATAADAPRIAALDRSANGYDRKAFLAHGSRPARGGRTLVLDAGGQVAGYATVRLCHAGIKIGPVVAPEADAAMRLIRAAAGVLGSPAAMIDVPARTRRCATGCLRPALCPVFRQRACIVARRRDRMERCRRSARWSSAEGPLTP